MNKRILIAVSTVSVVIIAAAPTYHRTRPAQRCDIPVRGYQNGKFSQPLRSLSNVALPIEVAQPPVMNNNLTGVLPAPLGSLLPKGKSFQFAKDPLLQINHCSLSEMSVVLYQDGKWIISARANQNPLNARNGLDVTTMEPKQQFTDHLQRNRFHVVAYCYAKYGVVDGNNLIGKPLVIPLQVNPFWVQRQQPYVLYATDYNPDIARYFDSIDRIEIEFFYQLD